jgi:FixJ family two-component response regulator
MIQDRVPPRREEEPTVFVVDDESSVRSSLQWLLESIRLKVETFESAEAFLAKILTDRPGCLVLDVRMPGLTGPELMDRLHEKHFGMPIIFLSGHGDVPLAVHTMKGGAFDFLQKPYNNQQFLERVRNALELDMKNRSMRRQQGDTGTRIDGLSGREREILDLVIEGQSNKVIGRALGISYKTVEAHRARLMRKMGVASFAELMQVVLAFRGHS